MDVTVTLRPFRWDDLGRAVRFCGECNWPDRVSQSGLLEPVGCHKDFRRLGLARALLHEGMRQLRSQGIGVAVVEPLVPAQNPAAYALYESVGFRPQCGWLKYRKTLALKVQGQG